MYLIPASTGTTNTSGYLVLLVISCIALTLSTVVFITTYGKEPLVPFPVVLLAEEPSSVNVESPRCLVTWLEVSGLGVLLTAVDSHEILQDHVVHVLRCQVIRTRI